MIGRYWPIKWPRADSEMAAGASAQRGKFTRDVDTNRFNQRLF
jgi:hypothetical protein